MLKIPRLLALVLATLPALGAQTVRSVFVNKSEYFLQSGPGPLGIPANYDLSNPFGSAGFYVDVRGTDLNNLGAPSVVLAPGSTYPAANPAVHNGGTLVFNAEGGWGYGSPNGEGVAAPTPLQNATANVNTYFRFGNYRVNVTGTPVNLNLGPDPLGGTMPAVVSPAFSQGTWSNGTLLVDPTKPLTITTNSYPAYLTGGIGGHTELGLQGPAGIVFDIEKYSRTAPIGVATDEAPGGVLSYTIPANTLAAATDYEGIGAFARIVSRSVALPDSFNVGFFGRVTFYNIRALDTLAPEVTVPGDMVVEATSPNGAAVTFTASANDNVDGSLPVSISPASGGIFPIGTTIVTASATDAAGNTGSASFSITIRDTTAPVIAALQATPSVLWPVNHKMVAVAIIATVTDASDPTPATRIVSVSSNEPANGKGDGNTSADWQITGPMTLNLRAERSGNASDRVYTIKVESKDRFGNTSAGTVNVIVPHNQ